MQTDPVSKDALPRRRSRLRWIADLVIGAVGMSVIGCNALQQRLIYPARHYDYAEFERRVRERFPADAFILSPFVAIVIEPSSPAVATAIWFHGNGNVNTDFARVARSSTRAACGWSWRNTRGTELVTAIRQSACSSTMRGRSMRRSAHAMQGLSFSSVSRSGRVSLPSLPPRAVFLSRGVSR